MNIRKDDTRKISWKDNILSILVIAAVISIMFLLKCYFSGIYPYGTNTIDRGDFFGQIVPSYYFIYDVIHGDANLFFDWFTGLGQNMSAVITHFNLLSPFNIFFLFCDRADIENYMTYYILLKLIAATITMYVLLRKIRTDRSPMLSVTFSIIYALGGFNIQNLEVPCWMDAVIIFPLFIMGIYNLIQNKDNRLYIVTLWLILILDVIQTVNYAFFTVLFIGTLLLFNRIDLKVIYRLFISTIIAFGFSAPIFIPSMVQLTNSYRLSGISGYFGILSTIDYSNRFKWLMLYNLGFALGIIVLAVFKKTRNKSLIKDDLTRLVMILFLLAPVILESTNMLWSLGSYVNFPMRMGYMLSASVIIIAARYENVLSENYKTDTTLGKKKVVLLSGVAIIVCVTECLLCWYILNNNKGYAYIAFSLLIMFMAVYIWTKSGFNRVILAIISASMLVNTYSLTDAYVIPTSHDTAPVISGSYPDELKCQGLNRVKNIDGYEDSNYPVVMRQLALSSYMHVISESQHEMNYDLGYSTIHTRLSDVGGTFFSDALLGVKSVFSLSYVSLPADLYLYETEGDGFSYYSPENAFDGFLMVSESESSFDFDNPFDYQNQLSEMVFGKQIFDVTEYGGVDESVEFTETYKDETVVYLYGKNLVDSEISINGEKISIFNRFDSTNIVYPNIWNNGIICLGVFSDEQVQVDISNVSQDSTLYIGTCDLDDYRELKCNLADITYFMQGNAALDISIDNNSDSKYLLLPVYNDKGWKCRVNGNDVNIEGVIDNAIMLIPIEKGINNIELKYAPVGLNIGIIIFIITVLLVIMSLKLPISSKIDMVIDKTLTHDALIRVVKLIYIAFVAVLYFVPLLFLVLGLFV